MLLLGISLNAALPFLASASAIPLNFKALSLTTIPNANLSSSFFNSTSPVQNPNTNIAAYRAICMENRAGLDLTAVGNDCSVLLNENILRFEGLFENKTFYGDSYMKPNGRWAVAKWRFHECTIYVKSARVASTDCFTLFEVALTANKILLDCVASYRRGQGGLMPIGSSGNNFFVGLQGTLPNPHHIKAINDANVETSSGFDLSQRTTKAKEAFRGTTTLQPRILNPSGGLVSLNEALSSSNATRNREGTMNHEINCYPPGSRLPNANADDCQFVINFIILGLKDPLRVQTWGYTDAVDINLSLPESTWAFKGCAIRVRNMDERQVDRFRPLDVADMAQRIVQQCVTQRKEPLGGDGDIGRLDVPRNFYVVVSGTNMIRRESLGNDSTLALPSGRPRSPERIDVSDFARARFVANDSYRGIEAQRRVSCSLLRSRLNNPHDACRRLGL